MLDAGLIVEIAVAIYPMFPHSALPVHRRRQHPHRFLESHDQLRCLLHLLPQKLQQPVSRMYIGEIFCRTYYRLSIQSEKIFGREMARSRVCHGASSREKFDEGLIFVSIVSMACGQEREFIGS